ncbi:MAG: pyruvate kinase [Actinobacteria bacterium]|nr:pyruvate kinase [Actinomycetota bacterium]
MSLRRTKIVATLGPSSEGEQQIRSLVEAGVDAIRLNFSHGSHGEHSQAIATVRAAASELGRFIAIIADLQGPKIRIGEMPDGGVDLIRGRQVTLTTQRITGTRDLVPVNYAELPKVVAAGGRILLDDGRIALKVLEITDGDVICRVTAGGSLVSRKGVNMPGAQITAPSLTAKDRQDLDFALQAGVDYVALSFVRSAEDITELRGMIKSRTERNVRIIAKIEKHEAIRNITSIINVADAVMIARGDLGVEIAPERVPYWQKEIIRRAVKRAKTVITATEMLESMIERPIPTRAEASDVANAVYDGTDAVMLSGETAIGKYPVKAVSTMHRIAKTVESTIRHRGDGHMRSGKSVTDAISAAACEISQNLDVRALVTPTSSGTTAMEVAKHRPPAPVLAVSSNRDVVNQLALVWGVEPCLVSPARDTDDMFAKAIESAREAGLAGPGDDIVITAGVMVNVPGTTNLIKVHRMEEG